MKKTFKSMKVRLSLLAVFFFLLGTGYSYAWGEFAQIPLTIGFDDPVPFTPGHGKDAPMIPTIVQNGYEISFQTSHPAYTLYIIEEGTVVYSVAVTSSTTSIILPSWLSGEYEILLHPNDYNYYFYGFITL